MFCWGLLFTAFSLACGLHGVRVSLACLVLLLCWFILVFVGLVWFMCFDVGGFSWWVLELCGFVDLRVVVVELVALSFRGLVVCGDFVVCLVADL